MYHHLLIAIDLLDSDLPVLTTGKRLAQQFGSRTTVLHVCDAHVTGYGSCTARHHVANDMQVRQECFPHLKQLLHRAAIEPDDTRLLFGRPADVIHQFADQHHCDLVVVGSHGYAGVKALLGTTANQVLHGATTDVLTVRIEA